MTEIGTYLDRSYDRGVADGIKSKQKTPADVEVAFAEVIKTLYLEHRLTPDDERNLRECLARLLDVPG